MTILSIAFCVWITIVDTMESRINNWVHEGRFELTVIVPDADEKSPQVLIIKSAETPRREEEEEVTTILRRKINITKRNLEKILD